MQLPRQLALLYGIIAGVLAAIGVVVLLVGMGFVNAGKRAKSAALSSWPAHVSLVDFVILIVISGLIMVAGLLAIGSYWRTKKVAANIAQENARRQREAVEKGLKRLRERMSLPSLIEQNRLMLTEYHSIATKQAQESFRFSQRAMLGGFTWLIACFTAVIFVHSLNGRIIVATMAPAGSILAGFLGRTYILVYDRALVQLSKYYSQPLLNSYYLAAERLASEMSDETKDRSIGDVVEQLLAVARNLGEEPARANTARRGIRIRVPGMRPVPASEDDSKTIG